jgi:transposase
MARKPSRIRRTFTPQFKKDAVALVLGGRTVNEVAHDLGIARSLLQRWKCQLAHEPDLPAPFPGSGRLAPQAEQVRQLQQRLRAVTEERDILQEALAYVADEPEVKFHFIAAHRAEFRVRSLCRVLGVHFSGATSVGCMRGLGGRL